MKIFGDRLKDLRIERNLTMQQLAKNVGVSTMAISRWERDLREPSLENAKQIAIFFKVSTDYLCGLED